MGCDIHAYLEKYEKNEWKCIRRLYEDCRCYNLFGLLAGVRTPIIPIFPLRGIPKNISQDVETVLEDYGDDAHSRTWYTVEELLYFKGPIKEEKMKKNSWKSVIIGFEKGYVNYYQQDIFKSLETFNLEIKKLIKKNDKKLYRVVMFFDN